MDNQTPWKFDSRIPNDTLIGKQVIDELLSALARLEWPETDVFGIHLAVEEAIVNAIKHGNQDDPSKFIDVLMEVSREHIRIEITDQGQGFDPTQVPDPTDDENLELPSGRGLMLMRCYMTMVEFNARGNGVIMAKERG